MGASENQGGVGCEGARTTEGGEQRENRNVEKKQAEERKSGAVRGRGHKGSAGRSQSTLCKQASSWSGQVAGGVLHGPLGLLAEQITDGRNVAFVLKKRESGRKRRREERGRSSTSGRKRGRQLTST